MSFGPLQVLKRAYWRWHAQARATPAPPPSPPAGARVPPALRFGCDLVLDVGANTGQYAARLRELGYGGKILSFEPLPDAHAQLLARAAADPLWEVHPRCALGAAAGTGALNVAGNSVSSSLLPMLDLHAAAAPRSIYIGQVETPVTTLDALLECGFSATALPQDRYTGLRGGGPGGLRRSPAAHPCRGDRAFARAAVCRSAVVALVHRFLRVAGF